MVEDDEVGEGGNGSENVLRGHGGSDDVNHVE